MFSGNKGNSDYSSCNIFCDVDLKKVHLNESKNDRREMLYLWTASWHIFSFVFVFMLTVNIVDNIFSDSSLAVADYAFYIIHVVQVLATFYAFSNQNLHTKGQFFSCF